MRSSPNANRLSQIHSFLCMYCYIHCMYCYIHCMYVAHLLYLLVCGWTFWIFACLGGCKQCPGEKWGAPVFLKDDFPWMFAQDAGCQITSSLLKPHLLPFCCCCCCFFPAAVSTLLSQQQCGKVPFPPGTLQHLLIVDFMLTAVR